MVLDGYTVRPSMGSPRVDVICGRCKAPIRDGALSGVPTVASITAAAEAHEKRLHRPKLAAVAGSLEVAR